MNRELEQAEDLIDLGAASVETKGGPVALPIDDQGFYTQAGISDD
jgi:hypothetical protein